MAKKESLLGKKVYMLDQHTYGKISSVDKNGTPLSITVKDTIIDLTKQFVLWIVGHSQKAVIDNLKLTIRIQNTHIREIEKQLDLATLQIEELNKKLKDAGIN